MAADAEGGYQGRPGAFSEDAARALMGAHSVLRPFETLEEVFAALYRGHVPMVVVPVENSLAGPVPGVRDLLARYRVRARAERLHPVIQALIGVPGAREVGLREVRSHPMALAQCRRFLAANPGLSAVPTFDTAGAVEDIIRSGDDTLAAIAGPRAAALYGGVVLRPRVADRDDNITRFLLLSMERAPDRRPSDGV